jgi:carboxypeptidase family protein/TonB-dependent receptor-like protein
MRARLTAFGLALAALSISSPALAQLAQGELRGTVVDESGGVLPGVAVTAIHVETGTSRSTTTAANGGYLMPAMPLGTYKMTAELAGFSTMVREGFRLSVGETATINFTMKVATLQESVTVSGAAPMIDTKKSELTGNINPEQVQQLPLNGRNWLDLVSMVPGARGNLGDIRAGASGSDAARYQVDGLSVTGQGTGGETQSYGLDVIAEMQVLTNRFDAEYGRVTGAVVNAVTKSGTNQFRGSVYDSLRDDSMNAKDFVRGTVTPLHETQAGFTLGGPLVRDRAHFFGSYERQRRAITNIPTTGLPQFDVGVSAPITRHLITGRIDTQLSRAHRLFFRTNPFKETRMNEGISGKAVFNAGDNYRAYNQDGVTGETWVLNDRLVNEVRTGLFYFHKKLEELAAQPRYGFPSVTLGPATNVPQWWKERIFQFNESISYFVPAWRGEHRFKAGFQYQRSYYQGELPSRSYGNFSFDRDPSNFLDPSTYPRPTSYGVSIGDFHYDVVNPAYGAYAQDDWTLQPRLTLNLGVRYDLEPKVDNPGLEEMRVEPEKRKVRKTNFAPRIGFTYDLRGDGNSVIRGGAGRYYGNILLNIPMNEARNRNRQVQITVVNPDLNNPLQGLNFEQLLAAPRNLVVMAADYQAPVQDQMSIGFAQQIGDRFAFQADVVHLTGRHIQMSRSINFFEDPVLHVPINPTVAGRPYPQFVDITRYESTGHSRYDGLQVGFTGRRAARGRIDFQSSYTLARTKGSTDSNRFGAVNNPFNLEDEYAYSNADQRHRFLVNGTTRLPYDVTVSAIWFTGSPKPLNITTSLNPFRSGGTRWLDAQGRVLPKNGERAPHWDNKLDLRLAKNFRVSRVTIQGLMDVFNILNITNYGSYGTTFGTAQYLQPAFTTNTFYQPRMLQVGFRITY